ncbi:sensor histidine kinase [Novosphingobium capsulatum]|uniref:sensor histidine kinase n=1 Tax=Novosphingobium capsulatum TaxID=13688 RepID=UPI0012EE179C|nr:histidine kinase [Novosphingobium capsulatum]WQD94487.1 histidine kinase [Novosphingobium capsulatum]
MEIRHMYARRSGKVLALCRLTMAAMFMAGIVFSPDVALRNPGITRILAGGYVFWVIVLACAAWTDWWYDCRLAPAAQVIDFVAFAGAIYFTERPQGVLTGPFLVFGTFLLLVALVRWGTIGVATTGMGLFFAAIVPAGMLTLGGAAPDPLRFVRGLICMVVVSMLMLWLASRQRGRRVVTLPEPAGPPGARRNRVLASALRQACLTMGARGAALAVAWGDEPWIDLLIEDDGRVTSERQGPSALSTALAMPAPPTLFDRQRARRIGLPAEHQLVIERSTAAIPLAEICGVNEGILATFSSVSSQGQLLVWGIPAMAVDDLPWMSALVREIGLALDREEMATLAKSSAVAEVRNALARDLHDSVVQFLAGTMFRLEALRRRLRDGKDPEDEIVAMKEALRREQAQLRVMIDRLRRGEDGDRAADVTEELRSLVEEMSAHWRVHIRFDGQTGPLPVPIHLAYELRQMVREAVANAARHGQCSEVMISLHHDGSTLTVTIADDGVGFPGAGQLCQPRSITERVAALGGRVRIAEHSNNHLRPGARLDIEVPTRINA